jgi:hypothetical protein
LLLVLVGTYVYFSSWGSPPLDVATLCPKKGPQALTVILVDRTDPLTAVQQQALRQRLHGIKDDMARYEGLTVYSVGPVDHELLRPEIPRLCNPGRGTDIHPAIGNPRLVERTWQERFSAPLDRLFDELLKPHKARTSPIMESIQSVAVTAFQGRQISKISRRLVIVSDMLQHSTEYSQYDAIRSFETFRQSPYYHQVRTDLRGIEVEILYVRRTTRHRVQGKGHIEFWQHYIRDMGGVLTHVVALEG